MLWGRRDTANKSCWHVWEVLAVYGPHWVCLSLRWCVLPGSTLLRLQGAQQGHCPKQFHALPRSKLLRFLGTPQRQTQLGMRFVPFRGLSSSGDQVFGEHTIPSGHFPRWTVRLNHLPIRPLSFPSAPPEHRVRYPVCLLWGADLGLRPSWQMSTV